ncbi:DUF1949 domain-containing protein [candidate division GN15 bacterium]|nr:DUF1949 domain-containing protein [candidate division GN15 bacterium]
MDDTYRTIGRESRVETKVKGSRFIAESRLVATVDEAMARLENIRKREHAATHHCWAYRVGLDNEQVFKYSDDGEPTGTAGRPIFDVIEGDDVTHCLIVVTRYYGGTKLGTGGLARAYGEAAREVMNSSRVTVRHLTQRFELELDFSHYKVVELMLARLKATVRDSQFTDRVRLVVEVRQSLAERLEREYVELTHGKAKIEAIDGAESD